MDQRIGSKAVADIGTVEDGTADQARALFGSEMRLVAEEAALPARW